MRCGFISDLVSTSRPLCVSRNRSSGRIISCHAPFLNPHAQQGISYHGGKSVFPYHRAGHLLLQEGHGGTYTKGYSLQCMLWKTLR